MENDIFVVGDIEILSDYSIFINVTGPLDEPRYFRIDVIGSEVTGPGRFVSPVEIMLMEQPHFVIRPLSASGHFERPAGQIVWGNSFMLALYDPETEDAWTIGGIMGKAAFEYAEMFVVENKSARVLDKVRRDFNRYVPVLLIAKDATGWHSKFFEADPEREVPEWLH